MKQIDLAADPAFFRGIVKPFVRMNQSLLDFYSCNPSWLIRAKCASGITIKFNTDAEILQFDIEFGDPARKIFTLDVEVNNVLTTIDLLSKNTVELAPGKKDVAIYLPHLVVLNKFVLSVNAQATLETVKENQPKLLVCGDSILQGMTCTSPARASVAITARALNMQLHNTSVGGARMEPTAVKSSLELAGKGDIAIVGFGGNDAAQNLDLAIFRDKTRQCLEYLEAFAGKSLILTPIPTMREFEAKREIYCNIIREEQSKCSRVKLLEGNSFFPAGNPDLFADGLHPNDPGMEIYAQGVIKALKEL